MKKFIWILSTLVLGSLTFAFMPSGNTIEIGERAPMTDVEMEDISGETHSLESIKKENGLLVIFSCNTCPFVLGWEETYPVLGEITATNNIGMVLVNSNEAKREDEDSMDAMKDKYESGNYNTPYVIDTNNELADAFGAQTTPHVFLFNGDMELVYRGLIDDKYDNRDKKATQMYLKDAIEAMLNGNTPNPEATPEKGCSIKRVKP